MNKNGWGLRFELLFIFIFLFCLLISTIGLNKMGLLGEGDKYTDIIDKGSEEYKDIEKSIRDAALNYYKNNYKNSSDTLIIKTSTLYANGYLSKIKDSKGRECKGYAKITSSGNVASYINCPRYKTSGYQKDYE